MMSPYSCVLLLLTVAPAEHTPHTLQEMSSTLLLNQLAMANVLAERDSGTRVIRKWMDEQQVNITSEIAAILANGRVVFQDEVKEIVKKEVEVLMEVVSSRVSAPSLPQPQHQSGDITCQRDRPADCLGYRRLGFNASGVYDIYPISCCQPVSVWCDMVTSGGGWAVALSRGPQLVPENFARLWDDYKSGFGNPNREYWIGNEVLHHMTKTIPTAVRVDVEDFNGNRKFGEWGRFSVANESQLYKLAVDNYWEVSTLGDDLKRNNGANFTTLDHDNDDNSGNCAEQRTGGGWWFTSCSDCTPTAVMANTNNFLSSAIWKYWQKDDPGFTSLRWLQLKIRPEDSQGPVRKCSEE